MSIVPQSPLPLVRASQEATTVPFAVTTSPGIRYSMYPPVFASKISIFSRAVV